jgi:hypothetical protein
MDYKIAFYSDVSQGQWDSWVASIRAASYHHSRCWLDYCSGFQNVVENKSLALLENDSSPLAICPLVLSEIDGHREISVNGAPVGVPALAESLKPSPRRRILDIVFGIINDYAKGNNAERIVMVSHPLTRSAGEDDVSGFRNSFELLRYQMLYRVENTLVIDLKLPPETLFMNMGKYQRRHIVRGRKQNIRVEVFNGGENKDKLRNCFELFQQAHFTCAGRLTRPQATWDSMYQSALNGYSSLFCAFLGDTPMSYLFCGEFAPMAFGWSQANVEKFEEEYSPRHILEWEAILYYKKLGFRYYEIGERYYCPQLLHVPSAKEITISEFKERYGGFMLPKINWLGYCDNTRMSHDLRRYQDSYLANDNLVKIPGGMNSCE